MIRLRMCDQYIIQDIWPYCTAVQCSTSKSTSDLASDVSTRSKIFNLYCYSNSQRSKSIVQVKISVDQFLFQKGSGELKGTKSIWDTQRKTAFK